MEDRVRDPCVAALLTGQRRDGRGALAVSWACVCFHLRLTHVLPRTGSRAGERRGSKFFRSSPSRNWAERRPGLERPLRGCSCPAGRLPLARGFAQRLLGKRRGKRRARGGRDGFRSPDDISGLAGAALSETRAGPAPGLSWGASASAALGHPPTS